MTLATAPNAEKPPLKVLLCSPRGFCAGVVRAIDSVERALALYGAPVYVRHEIVHNRYVVEGLKAKGAIFVEELDEIPDTDAPVIFSAHGVPSSVPDDAKQRNFFALDATCPLVTKVHREAEIHFKRGREIVLIGHAGHPEVVGTMGQLPDGARHAGPDARRSAVASCRKTRANLAYVTQTTLSVDDTAEIVELLKKRFPAIVGPHKEDICYATTNRQEAVKRVAPHGRCDDRGRRAEFVELAAAEGSRRARRLPACGAGAARERDRLGRVRRHCARSASPPAHRRRKCWSRKSSTPLPRATRSRSRPCRRPRRACSSRCRVRCAQTEAAE